MIIMSSVIFGYGDDELVRAILRRTAGVNKLALLILYRITFVCAGVCVCSHYIYAAASFVHYPHLSRESCTHI